MTSARTTQTWAAALMILAAFGGRAQTPPIILTDPVVDGPGVAVAWSGGTGPYLLQRKTTWADAAWMNVTTSAVYRVMIPNDSDTGFYRLVDATTNTVSAFSAWFTGNAVRPTPLTNSASAFGSFFLDGTMLTYKINYSGLSGDPLAAQLHAPASTSETTNLLQVLGPIVSGSSGTLTGHFTLTPIQRFYVSYGLAYVDIHTVAHLNGEIRGQIAPVLYSANLSPTNEVPALAGGGAGEAQLTLIGNQLWYNVVYTNLSSTATNASIYGPATVLQTNTVMQSLASPSGTAGTVSGKLILTPGQLGALIDQTTYLNIHTTLHGAGEIRGQIVPTGTSTSTGVGGGG